MNIGENIARLRKEKNMRQEDLARKLNVSFKTVSSWENNRNLPNIEMLLDLSKVLDTNIDSLLNVDENIKEKYQKKNNKDKILNILFVTILMLIPILYSIDSITGAVYNLKSTLMLNGILLDNDFQEAISMYSYIMGEYCLVYIIFMLGNYILYSLKFKKSLLVLTVIEIFFFIDSIITDIFGNDQSFYRMLENHDLWTIGIISLFGIIFSIKLWKKNRA